MGVDIRTVIGWTTNKNIIEGTLKGIATSINPDPDAFRDALYDHGILHSDMGGEDYYVISFADANADEGIVELEDMNDDSYVSRKFRELNENIMKWNDDEDTQAALKYLVDIMFKTGRLALLTYWC